MPLSDDQKNTITDFVYAVVQGKQMLLGEIHSEVLRQIRNQDVTFPEFTADEMREVLETSDRLKGKMKLEGEETVVSIDPPSSGFYVGKTKVKPFKNE